MGVLVGITGAIGSGKSTVADFLRNQESDHAYYESGELIAEVAEDFNRALSGELAFETTSDDVELTNQALIWFVESIAEKLHYTATWNQLAITKRLTIEQPELLGKLFIYLASVKQNPELLDARITRDNKEQYRPLLQWLGGYLVARLDSAIWYDELMHRIRMHDDEKNLIIIGGLRYPSDAAVVRKNQGVVLQIKRPIDAKDTHDVTEASRDDIEPDITLYNNGTLETLQTTIETFWNDLAAGKPAKTYISE